jgi:hypothetical protein
MGCQPTVQQTQITAFYRLMLLRDPDPGGYVTFMYLVSSPNTVQRQLRDSAFHIVASPEASAVYGGDVSSMLFQAYWAILNRAPDPGGYAFILSWLYSGHAWWEAVQGLVDSPEFAARADAVAYQNPPYGVSQLYHEADYYVGGNRSGRTEMHVTHFLSWRTFRDDADSSDAVDWSQDGCSFYMGPYLSHYPCTRHDFGWRNFKPSSAYALEPTLARKDEIDRQFQSDLDWFCDIEWLGWPSNWLCHVNADAAYVAVSTVNW